MSEEAKCELCGEPIPEGEDMFNYHGYSGPCPKPLTAPATLPKSANDDSLECQRTTTSPHYREPSQKFYNMIDKLLDEPGVLACGGTTSPGGEPAWRKDFDNWVYEAKKKWEIHAVDVVMAYRVWQGCMASVNQENADLRRQVKSLITELEDLNNAFCAEERLRISMERQLQEAREKLATAQQEKLK